jgi:hypothetical protein
VSLFIYQVGISQVQVSYSKADNMYFSKFKTFQFYSLDVKNTLEFEPKKEGIIVKIYVEGTVSMDIVSSKDNEMIWQAVLSGILKKNERRRQRR